MSDILTRFTRDGQTVISNAKRIAKKYKQPLITPDHLLLGLLQLSGSQAEAVLTALRVNPMQLKNRVEAIVKLASKDDNQGHDEVEHTERGANFSVAATAIIHEANGEAEANNLDFVDPRLLILGILRQADNSAAELLRQYGLTVDSFRAKADLQETPPTNQPRFKAPTIDADKLPPVYPSPIFLMLVLFTCVSGYLTYAGIGNASRTVFLFVLGGWITSVALHEFGHAIVAYLGGDKDVALRGYLTLNPLTYIDPLMTIFFPLLILLVGGFPLMGGAVLINTSVIRSQFTQALISAAGPMATLMCALGLSLPFLLLQNIHYFLEHYEFWSGLALLTFFQYVSLTINLLPVPGIDGFGIMSPFLPPEIVDIARRFRVLSFFVFFMVLFYTPFGQYIAEPAWQMMKAINPNLIFLVSEGFDLFFFWKT